MEERVPAATAGFDPSPNTPPANPNLLPPSLPHSHPNNKHHVISPPPSYHSRKISKAPSFSFAIEPETTYVIQIPKDQIFAVPPPEHAKIVERHRNEKKSSSQKSACCSSRCMSYTFAIVILIGIIIGVSIAIAHALIKPKLPIFNIQRLNSKESTGFNVALTVKDDGKMSISPDGNGETTLMYKNIEIGSGRFPGLRVGSGQTKAISLQLKGIGKGKMPTAVKESMADKKGKAPISLSLVMRIPVVMSASGVKSQSKEVNINCKLKVRSLGVSQSVTSQKCQGKFS
ncbi:unnamed protein product [Linum tenue]|uniref:Late embryogenesis abundant protein LEA-2 subgroup domain-containing protein n=1 Tax=Linum tenue TaxID=586396 RepID=A0AAV0L866_9ROSI|nr:unnamed protein product [Linum tenue]